MTATKSYVVVSTSEEEPIREGYDSREEADARAAELSDREEGDTRYAVAEMPAEEYAEFERCGNRSATFGLAELRALGVI